jgi:hypothetical protein
MLINFTRHTRNARLAAVALIAVCFFQPEIRNAHAAGAAHSPEANAGVVVLFSSIPVGLARGQTLRINVANVNKQRPCCVNNLKQFGLAIHNFNGEVIRRSDEIVIEPGEHHSFDFPRNEIPLAGEPTTGRLQVSVSCAVRTAETGDMDEFVASLEVMDSYTGSSVLYQDIFIPSPALARPEVQSLDLGTVGFVPGQTLRLTVAHVSTDVEQNQTPPNVRVGVWLLDSSGRVIAQSAEVQIPRNEFSSFDFSRAAINVPGEPGTGRLQVTARLMMNVAEPYHFTDDPRATALLVPSMELIDNSTGGTAAGCGCNNLKQIGLASH